ncbi:hypothetical protein J6590_056840 [Homalodisca vitripennis]|nr:hypothetical protein J6590_056840 [Homalodisca vitripennis]
MYKYKYVQVPDLLDQGNDANAIRAPKILLTGSKHSKVVCVRKDSLNLPTHSISFNHPYISSLLPNSKLPRQLKTATDFDSSHRDTAMSQEPKTLSCGSSIVSTPPSTDCVLTSLPPSPPSRIPPIMLYLTHITKPE